MMAGVDNKTKETLLSVFNSMTKTNIQGYDGEWINLASFGTVIKKAGMDFRSFGCEKLGEFVIKTGLFDVHIDNSTPPVKYIRKKIKKTAANTALSGNREDSPDVAKIKTRLRLNNNYFIGQFSPEPTLGWYKISDIRNTDFTKIEDKERGVQNLTICFRSRDKEFNKYAYYRFTWVLLESSSLKFGIDLREEVTPIFPKDIVQCISDSFANYTASSARKVTRTLDTLHKQLTQSGKEVFIYELLQNANDYPRMQWNGMKNLPIPVDVEFHITAEYLTFQHTGEYFNPKNIAAICDINDGEKSNNVEAIGYKGIGFKTVFLDNDYVYLNTGNYSFRFDKDATDIINTPWQILPVWTEPGTIDPIIKEVFNRHTNDIFRVKFALRPRDREILTDRSKKDNYIDLFSSVFETERVILFIPNIHKVSVFFGDMKKPAIVRSKDNKNWCVSDALTDDVPEFVRNRINEVLTDQDADRSDGYDKIPEKYLNFNKTAIRFACRKEGRKLLPVDDANLYCYLPAKKANWGFKFLMNTDMVPNGSRDDIEDIELNHEIAKIAGRQFFYWIKSLIASGEYELDSIFSLIPDFDECKDRHENYEDFIGEFKEEFENLITEEPFVPVVDENGNEQEACIDTILDDETGITKNRVMSDSDFISLMGKSGYCLPVQELRESESFMDFLYQYSPSELDIDFDDVKANCTNDDFRNWLKNLGNNNKFIGHLLNNDQLKEFSDKTVFIEFEGDLFEAGDLYYDFDSNCSTISFLRSFIPHLSKNTREYFKDNEAWDAFVDDSFKEFDAVKVIENCVIDNENALALLEELDNSVCFYRFIGEQEVDLSDQKDKIPFIDEDGKAHYGYDGYLYFFSDEVYSLSKCSWLGENVITVLSHTYREKDTDGILKGVFDDLGVVSFVKSEFICDIIAGNDDFRDGVNAAIDDNFEANISFLKYVFDGREVLKEKVGQLNDYLLRCLNIEDYEIYLCNDDLRYFSQMPYAGNTTFEDNKAHTWLKDDMMYCLDPVYFDEFAQEDRKALESFLRQVFGIKTFTNKSFFTDVVLKNRKIIYGSLKDEATILAFLNYLKRDANDIFDGSVSFNDMKDMPLLCSDGSVISERDVSVRLVAFDTAAKELRDKEWCPDGLFEVLSIEYSTGLGKDPLQLLKIEVFDFAASIEDLVTDEGFQDNLCDNDSNVDFWRWIKANQKSIEKYEKLQSLKMVDSEGTTNCACPDLYISDIYQKNGIESLVKKYDEDASFVSEDYPENETETCKNEWFRLFKKLGLKSDNKDILFNSILPNLSDFEDDAVAAILTKHLADIKEVWGEHKKEVKELKVRTRSGNYLTLDQTVIIDVDEETVAEPFKNIELSDEIAPEILKSNKELILLVAKEFDNKNILTDKQKWAQKKISEYINNIQDESALREPIHIDVVRELAKMNESYDFPSSLLSKIKYKVKGTNGEYKLDTELTLGTAYDPICDFESNGAKDLSYLSEDYISSNNKDTIKSFFKSTEIHQSFTKDDLSLLSIRRFSVYFWEKCFSRRMSQYEKWIEDGVFDDIECIPTETSVKKPDELYSPLISHYVMQSPEWKEKLPAKIVVDKIDNQEAREIFNKLPFKSCLEFEDCLYYLLNARDPREDERGRRKRIIDWMLSADEINEDAVSSYREQPTAKWRNGKGKWMHIRDLYAIHPDASQERTIFSGDEHVMQTSMFPDNIDDFEHICDILGITYLKSSDFKPIPSLPYEDETTAVIDKIKPKLLVLAAIENSEKYQQIYEGYVEVLSNYRFLVCDKIDLGYDTIHNDVERIYSDDDHIYYVNSRTHNRTYTKFCNKLKKLLGIKVYDNVCEDVLDDSMAVEDCIDKYCTSLAYDKTFRKFLEELNLSISVVEDEPEEEEENYYSEALSKSDRTDEEAPKNEVGSEDIKSENEQSSSKEYRHPKEPEEDEPELGESDEEESDKQEDGTSYSNRDSGRKSSNSEREPAYKPYEVGPNELEGPRRPSGSQNRGYGEPKPFTKDDVERMKSRGVVRCLAEGNPEPIEIEHLNNLLGTNMTAEEIADTNYLAQMRLYQNLVDSGYDPKENEEDFVKSDEREHSLKSGKYIHKCSAAYGILYISPAIWNKVVDDRCIICVYLGKRAKDFMYLRSIKDILTWVDEDDILIKLTGEEKADVVNTLYTGVLEGVKGTAYTMIRLASNAIYDPVFAQMTDAPDQIDTLDEL